MVIRNYMQRVLKVNKFGIQGSIAILPCSALEFATWWKCSQSTSVQGENLPVWMILLKTLLVMASWVCQWVLSSTLQESFRSLYLPEYAHYCFQPWAFLLSLHLVHIPFPLFLALIAAFTTSMVSGSMQRGIEWFHPIWKCSQNLAFAQIARKN